MGSARACFDGGGRKGGAELWPKLLPRAGHVWQFSENVGYSVFQASFIHSLMGISFIHWWLTERLPRVSLCRHHHVQSLSHGVDSPEWGWGNREREIIHQQINNNYTDFSRLIINRESFKLLVTLLDRPQYRISGSGFCVLEALAGYVSFLCRKRLP